jgi:hypothetical protein
LENSQLPICVQYLVAFSTPLLALMVAAIAFLQWRTSHHKFMLDLFERRVEIIDDIRGVAADIQMHGQYTNKEIFKFLRSTRDAEFLFGKEITSYLDRTRTVLNEIHSLEGTLRTTESQEAREPAMKTLEAKQKELGGFLEEFTKLVTPYVQLHQKRLWI